MNKIEYLANIDKYKGEDHSTFLQHYGILGQKWGQRRWQNADGTFNDEGKIRYFGSKAAEQRIGNSGDEKIGGKFSDLNDKFVRAQARFATRHPNLTGTQGLTKDEIYSAYKNFRFLTLDGSTPTEQRRANLNALKAAKQAKELMKEAKETGDNSKLEELDQKLGAMEKKSNNPENKYQNEDGTLTKKGYKKFATKGGWFWNDDDEYLNSWNKDDAEKKIDTNKYKKAEAKHRSDVMNSLLNDDNLDIQDTLKSQIFNKTARKNMAKMLEWCKENGIKEVTPEMMEGNRLGNNYLNDAKYIKNNVDSGYYYNAQVLRNGQWVKVQSDPQIKNFLKNNKTYKDYEKLAKESKEKFNEICNDELRKLVEKELGITLPHTVINKKTGTLALNLTDYLNDEKVMKAVNNNLAKSIEAGNSNKEIINLNTQAYKTLQKCEKEATDFAREYLNSTANMKVPGTFTVNTKTGESGESSLVDSIAYDMLADDFMKFES